MFKNILKQNPRIPKELYYSITSTEPTINLKKFKDKVKYHLKTHKVKNTALCKNYTGGFIIETEINCLHYELNVSNTYDGNITIHFLKIYPNYDEVRAIFKERDDEGSDILINDGITVAFLPFYKDTNLEEIMFNLTLRFEIIDRDKEFLEQCLIDCQYIRHILGIGLINF